METEEKKILNEVCDVLFGQPYNGEKQKLLDRIKQLVSEQQNKNSSQKVTQEKIEHILNLKAENSNLSTQKSEKKTQEKIEQNLNLKAENSNLSTQKSENGTQKNSVLARIQNAESKSKVLQNELVSYSISVILNLLINQNYFLKVKIIF